MHLKTRVLLAVGCVSLLAMSMPAFSVPAPIGIAHKQHTVQKNKIAQHAAKSHKGPLNPHAAGKTHAARLVSMPIADPPKQPMFGWPTLVREARKYIGTNPTARTRLWCATFMNLVLAKAGYAGTNSDAAKSFASYGHRISDPQVGAIAVLSRGPNGGHVGVVSGIDRQGNPIIISGNHGHRVGEATYPRARVIAYVMPSDREPVSDTQVAELATPIMASAPIRASAPKTPRIPSAPRAPNRVPSESGIESPIAELLAAIEAEQTRPVANVRPARPPVQAVQTAPPTPHRTVQQMPEREQQVVQQPVRRPMQLAQQPVQHPAQQAAPPARRDLPLDPALVKLFGINARAQAAPPSHQAPQPQQRPGHVASADTGPADRQPVPP
jgi:uncharacterized protein (TIGR02594 family)